MHGGPKQVAPFLYALTSTVVEHPAVQPTTVRPYPSSVPSDVKDVFVWLTETPAPIGLYSDFCF